MTSQKKTLVAIALSALICAPVAWAQMQLAEAPPVSGGGGPGYVPQIGQAGKDVVWVPTPQTLVDRMLDMAQLRPGDRLVDLGSGDGRTVITAARRGVPARGIEYNPDMVELARQAARKAGVAQQAVFEQADIFKSDFSEATVVTLFLLPSLNVKLRPILLDMKPGTRILSNSFAMEDWQPDETSKVDHDCEGYCTAHKWVVPAKVEGLWQLGETELTLSQSFQMLRGTLIGNGTQAALTEGRLLGNQIAFSVNGQRYTGKVDGDVMSGQIDGNGQWTARRRKS